MKQEHCLLCFGDIQKDLSLYDWLKQDSCICGTCKQQLHRLDIDTHIEQMPLHILYEYNDVLEKLIFQYKEGHDVALAPMFFHEDLKKLHDRFRHYQIVLLPSSIEKNKERGFHAVKGMLDGIGLPMIEPFYKCKDHKQSLQRFENRQFISQIIKRDERVQLPSCPLLLIDDVCTSGSTISWAYSLLASHTYKVEALVLCAHPRFVESCDKKRLRTSGRFSILKHVVRNGR